MVDSTAPDPDEDRPVAGNITMPEPDGYYQYHWWGKKRANGLYDFTAVGHLGQFIFVRPDQNLIIVRLGYETDTEVDWFQKLPEIAGMLSN